MDIKSYLRDERGDRKKITISISSDTHERKEHVFKLAQKSGLGSINLSRAIEDFLNELLDAIEDEVQSKGSSDIPELKQ